MKVAIITDLHFGGRNDSLTFLDYFEKFYSTVFFPKLKDEGIDIVLIGGDVFDRRKYVNFLSLKRSREMFFDKLKEYNIKVHMVVGNHDLFYKTTNEVNSPALLLSEYDNINVIYEPTTISIDDTKICMLPWISPENYARSMAQIKETKATICLGHLEIEGFAMYRGLPSQEGLDRKLFRKFDITMSGHYHHRSSSEGIHYIGNPYELTWADYKDPRGFTILDLQSLEMKFVQNPYTIFHKIYYDDKEKLGIEDITSADYTKYKDTYVKVVVSNKSNPFLFDMFINKIYNANPADVTIMEELSDDFELEGEELLNEAEDTLTIINKYCDSFKTDNIDVDRLKKVMGQLYAEALAMETV